MNITCPIDTIDLPGIPDIKLKGLIVVIGPNSSGKSQLLNDINEAVCGKRRQLIVATGVSYGQFPEFEEVFNLLVENGIVRETSTDTFLKQTYQLGSSEGGGSFRKTQVSHFYQEFMPATKQKTTSSLPDHRFLHNFGPISCSVLFLRNRLSLMDQGSNLDFSTNSPSTLLQSLYNNKSAKIALHKEIANVFKCSVWVDNSVHGTLLMRVADTTEMPSAEDRLEPEIMRGFRQIEMEGDGIRSYSAICATLLLETRPLCLIDEPEMCLHTPQAHAMGRFIGDNASDDTCTLVATHSTHILRGILETNPNAHIIRLTRVSSSFGARALQPAELSEATSKPRSRSEAILEGLFSYAVILCEAEGDRLVYESTYRTLVDKQLDIRFVPSEGTGGFAEPLSLYRTLKIPCAVITDIDFLAKAGELKKVLTGLGTPTEEVKTLCERAGKAISSIKMSVSPISDVEIKEGIESIVKASSDLNNNGDTKLIGMLQGLSKKLYKLKDFKQKGFEAIPESIGEGGDVVLLRSTVEKLLSDLASHGLFLVQTGELESWLPIVMKGQSRENKSNWAMLAAEKIEDIGKRDEGIWQFIETVHSYLEEQLLKVSCRL